MRRFLQVFLPFAALQVALAVLLFAFYDPGSDRYLEATIDKSERLRTAPSPRIVFVGGSSLAFGLDSEQVAEVLPYEPVNMGLHGGLGLDFMLAQARAGLRPGDVVVLVIEYELFSLDATSDAVLETLEYYPQGFQLLSMHQAPVLLDSTLGWFGRVVRGGFRALQGREPGVSVPPYSRSSFNAMGDLVAHRTLPSREWNHRNILLGGLPERSLSHALASLESFRRFCEELGVRTVFAFASVPLSAYTPVESQIRRVRDRLVAETGLTVILEPEAAILDDEDFFDSPYHLTGHGTQRRMDLLLPVLTRALSDDAPATPLSADRAP